MCVKTNTCWNNQTKESYQALKYENYLGETGPGMNCNLHGLICIHSINHEDQQMEGLN